MTVFLEKGILLMRVLLVEDDVMIAQAVKAALTDELYTVEHVADGRDALMMLSVNEYGFVLLDLGLPGLDGMSVLKTFRAHAKETNTPIIIMTARDALQDRLDGLDAGADDYIVKPFHMSELLARMRAVLRRKNLSTERTLTNGIISLNVVDKTVSVVGQDKPITLSRREYSLLETLLTRPGAIYSRRQLEESIYEPGEEPESNAIEFLIHALRKKLGSEVIKNIRGLGWMVPKGAN